MTFDELEVQLLLLGWTQGEVEHEYYTKWFYGPNSKERLLAFCRDLPKLDGDKVRTWSAETSTFKSYEFLQNALAEVMCDI